MSTRYRIHKSRSLKCLRPYLSCTQVSKEVDVVLGVRLGVSIIHVDEPHHHGEIHVCHQVLCPERLEADGLEEAEADNHPV